MAQEALRSFGRLLGLLALALVFVAFGRLSLAAEHGSSPGLQAVPPQTSASPKPSGDSLTPVIAKLRIGVHPTFTRVVLELTGAQEFSVEQAGAGLKLLVPGAGLDEGVQRVDRARGLVRSVQFVRRAGGVEVLVACDSPRAKIRTLSLTDPDRIVVDILPPSPESAVQASAQLQRMVRPPVSSPSESGSPSTTIQAEAPPARPAQDTPPSISGRAIEPPSSPPLTARAQAGSLGASGETKRNEEIKPLTIVLDPGHGGHDTGAIGPSGLMEKDGVLDLASRLRKLLQGRLGVRVLMTRSEDVFVPLPERSAFANRAKADFMISLHVNAANARGAVGFETFYFTREPSDGDARASAQRENLVVESNGSGGGDLESLLKMTLADMAVTRDMKESSNLAERILAALDKILKVENRGVKSGPFYVLATAAMPAVLVESAFITNPREERRLQREDYRQRIAEGLYEGIAAYKVRYEQRLGLRTLPAGVGS